MEDHRLRSTLGAQHVEYLRVGLAIVNHQRLAGSLGKVDMPGEGLALTGRLCTSFEFPGPVQIHSGLADGHHPRRRCQLLEFVAGRGGQAVGTGGMQTHGGENPLIPFGGRSSPARRIEVVGDGDHRQHADGLGAIDNGAHVCGSARAAGVEVGVGVDQWRQRHRGRRCRTLRTLSAHRNTIGWC